MMMLETLNEKLYQNISRLHQYEGFMTEEQAKKVSAYIFDEYQNEVELFLESKKLKYETKKFELESINDELIPKSRFFGLFKNRAAKRTLESLAELEARYEEIYAPSACVYSALSQEICEGMDAEECPDADDEFIIDDEVAEDG